MTPKSPTAVLINGHHLQAPEWELIIWGNKDLSRVGRIPRGIEMAVKEDAELIMWGTAASSDPETEKKESEYTQAYALAHAEELAAYVGRTKEEVVSLIESRSVVQLNSNNTKNEIHTALSLCEERDIHTLYLVSSPTHVPRCLLTAARFQEEFPDIVLCGVAAETAPDFWHPKDVSIVEPAHRPDRSEAPMNLLAKRMTTARKYKEPAARLYEDLKKRLDEFDEEIRQNERS